MNHLRQTFSRPEPEISNWIAKWIRQGLGAVEALIGDTGYCFGLNPSLADVYLVPQLYAARRFKVPLEAYPRVARVDWHASEHPAFQSAHPSNQPDVE